jgi:TonB family protein
MKFIKQEKKKHRLMPAVCFSLLIHFSVLALLVFGLSTNLISPPKLNGINLVWVSLNAKSDNSGFAIQKNHLEQPSPAAGKRKVKEPAKTEKPEFKSEAAQILAAKELTNTVTLAQYDVSGTGYKEQAYNTTTNYSTNQTAGGTSNLNTVIAYPLYRENTPPAYPEIARVRGYEGIVLVSAEILPDGRVGNMKIRKSSGYAILDQSAIEAVKPWKFEPAKKSGNPFTVWVELPIKFILHNDSSQS